MIKKIKLGGREIEYELERKKVKNINLRIRPDGSVYVSASTRVPLERIESFLCSNESFIFNAVEKCRKRAESAPKPLRYESGEEVLLLGARFPLEIQKSTKNRACFENGKIIVFVKDDTDIELKKKILEDFFNEVCRLAVKEACVKVYRDFKECVPEHPTVKLRKMHTKLQKFSTNKV